MTTVLAIQKRLTSLGFTPGAADGLIGPATLGAMDAALDRLSTLTKTPAPVEQPASAVIPTDWLPWAKMDRIIVHWSAGSNKASDLDRTHYHLIIEGDGKLIRGKPSILLNQAPVKTGYAAHTLNCNSGSIGVSLAGMAGAVQSPFSAGKSPITAKQWEVLMPVLAQIVRRYSIPVTAGTILTHAEVQSTLGITQKGKWDIAILPFDPSKNTAKKVGDAMRAAVKALV